MRLPAARACLLGRDDLEKLLLSRRAVNRGEEIMIAPAMSFSRGTPVKQNDECAVQRARSISLETIAGMPSTRLHKRPGDYLLHA
jgi:hypothetical protein